MASHTMQGQFQVPAIDHEALPALTQSNLLPFSCAPSALCGAGQTPTCFLRRGKAVLRAPWGTGKGLILWCLKGWTEFALVTWSTIRNEILTIFGEPFKQACGMEALEWLLDQYLEVSRNFKQVNKCAITIFQHLYFT
jgi:hypothetical protein